ncbi:MAG: vWA domain-containing protein [Thermoguttaceae bacterium]
MTQKLPAWLGSFVFHAALLALLVLCIRFTPEIKGAPGEMTNNVGLILKSESNNQTVFQSETEAFQADSTNSSLHQITSDLSDLLNENNVASTASAFLPPKTDIVLGPTSKSAASESAVRAAIGNEKLAGGTVSSESQTTVEFWGTQGTGTRFAFVLDRSGSMNENNGWLIQTAKAKLINALDGLKDVHQLLIVFYNEEPTVYLSSGQTSASLIYATETNREAAAGFIRSIIPTGGTNHEQALIVAAKLKPDVIFLLTDGEKKDDLTPRQLQQIQNIAAGVQINVIQLGYGAEPPGNNYLKNLSTRFNGQYQYVNIRNEK